MYCRLLDPKGSGWAVVDIKQAAADLCLSESSIRFYKKMCLSRGLFYRANKLGPGQYKVFYVSQVKLAQKHFVRNGFGVKVGIDQLGEWKTLPVWAIANTMQQRSRREAWKDYKERSGFIDREIPRYEYIDEAFPKPEEQYSSLFSAGARFLLQRDWELCYGASQRTIAKHGGISVSTVRRHLQKLGKDSIRQFATRCPIEAITPTCYRSLKGNLSVDYRKEQRLETAEKRFKNVRWSQQRILSDRNDVEQVWTLLNNLYIFPLSVSPARLRLRGLKCKKQ